MAEYTALAPLFTDIANAIRSKTGETGAITASSFPQEINNISNNGGLNTLVYAQQIDFSASNSITISPTGITAKKDVLLELVFQNGTSFDTDDNDQYITVNGAKIAGGYKSVTTTTSVITCQYLLRYLATTNSLDGYERWIYLGRNAHGSLEYTCNSNAF